MLKYHYVQPKQVGFAKYSFNEHNGRSDNVRPMVGFCWTAISYRLGVINSTVALYQIVELENFQEL